MNGVLIQDPHMNINNQQIQGSIMVIDAFGNILMNGRQVQGTSTTRNGTVQPQEFNRSNAQWSGFQMQPATFGWDSAEFDRDMAQFDRDMFIRATSSFGSGMST